MKNKIGLTLLLLISLLAASASAESFSCDESPESGGTFTCRELLSAAQDSMRTMARKAKRFKRKQRAKANFCSQRRKARNKRCNRLREQSEALQFAQALLKNALNSQTKQCNCPEATL